MITYVEADEIVDELVTIASRLNRQCECVPDYRCINCDNILRVRELAQRLRDKA